MSFADDNGYFAWDEEDFEEQLENERLAKIEKNRMDSFTDEQFLIYVLKHGRKDQMNRTVPRNSFPAYDIAKRLSETQKYISYKQRTSILNVYLFDKYKIQFKRAR